MEFKLAFILRKVPSQIHVIYLERFVKRFFQVPTSHSLVLDLIRFICYVVHPSNSILRSEVIQRWDLIKSFFYFIKDQALLEHAMLTLFFDWMFFEPLIDNFMNIGKKKLNKEPSALLMERLALNKRKKSEDYLVNSLLLFLSELPKKYFSIWENFFRWHIRLALYTLIDKKVIGY